MRRIALSIAALVLLGFAPGALADGNPDAPPRPDGLTCGLASASTAADSYQQGVVWAGPLSPAPGAGPMAVRCTIRIDGVEYWSAQSTFADPAVLSPTRVEYPVQPGSRVEVCTTFVYPNLDDPYDTDPQAEGIQCDRAESVAAGGTTAYVVTPDLLLDEFCYYAPIPPSGNEICPPYPSELPRPAQHGRQLCLDQPNPPGGSLFCFPDPVKALIELLPDLA